MTDLSMSTAVDNTTLPAEPSDLDVAIRVAQQILDSDQALSLREGLRLLLRALDAEPADKKGSGLVRTPGGDQRCPAAHIEDPTGCNGPVAVMVLDAANTGARGCEHHAARLLASLEGGRAYSLPDAPAGAALRVFKAAAQTRPFAWVDGPRTHPSQLSDAENWAPGERR